MEGNGVARGRAIGQLLNNSEVIAQGFFETVLIAQHRKVTMSD